MAKVIEFRTVNIAVPDWQAVAAAFATFGVAPAEPHVFDQPPAEIIDVGFRIPSGGGWSLISPTSENSPIYRFLKKRGPGIYSMTLRVDNLIEAMDEWTVGGIEWIRPTPAIFFNADVPPFRVEKLLMNWIKPSSLAGVLVEVIEFSGVVVERDRCDT